MNLYQKLLEIQKQVDTIIKDGKNTSDKYDFASDENVLDIFRPLMDANSLLLIPRMENAKLTEGVTRSGTTRFMTEIYFNMVWVDVDSGETLEVPFYAQGVDLAGEKGVGKAASYAEKYFLLKFFHVATKKDDPDNDNRTKSGEIRQKGTAAEKETADYQRKCISAMLNELCAGDAEKIKASLITFTKSDKRGYAGVDSVERITSAALPVVYSKLSKKYTERTGKEFALNKED